MNTRIAKFKTETSIDSTKSSPNKARKFKSFLLPQIKDTNLSPSSSRQFLHPEQTKDSLPSVFKTQLPTPKSDETISSNSSYSSFSQVAQAISSSILSSDQSSASDTNKFSPSNIDSPVSMPTPNKEKFKYKIIPASTEEDPFIVAPLKIRRRKSDLVLDNVKRSASAANICEENSLPLSQELANMKNKYEGLEEIYFSDTNMLKRETEKKKQKYKKLKEDHKLLAQRYELLNEKYREKAEGIAKFKESFDENKFKLEKVSKDLEYQQFLNSRVLNGVKDYNNRLIKEDVETVQVLLEKKSEFENFIKKQDQEIRELKKIIDGKNAEIDKQKEKIKTLQLNVIEMTNFKEKNVKLKKKLNKAKNALDNAVLDCKNISLTHTESIKRFSQAENDLKTTINNLSYATSLKLERISKIKVLKNPTCYKGLYENADDNFKKLSKKVEILENDLLVCKEENQKLLKDLEYMKKITEEKNARIEMIEKKCMENDENKVNQAKQVTLKSVAKIIKKYEKKVENLIFDVYCNKCTESLEKNTDDSKENLLLSCPHKLLNDCEIFGEFAKEFRSEFFFDD
ncbi:hypothetical protein SteCoe_17520 [Stentor coeruleus]|uniref:Uncharacterized protein n=1 Tax=Stentor coeruleus TaxID=5963 RepID=A0A1R2BYV8_9CILI|nr:hypothetical protein SteCoe_17520 [Stentor coeruleus]